MADISQLEKLYLPSWWSKRYPPDVILTKYVEKTTIISDQVTIEVPGNLDIPYGNGTKQKFDIFGTSLPDDAPIFIYIHGGYWQEEIITRENSRYPARVLFKKGCKTIIIGYTLCPENTITQINRDIENALKLCLKYALEKGSKSLSIGGHSAGANIAISLFPNFYNSLPDVERCLIKSIVLIAGVYDITALTETTINVPLKLNKTTAKELSPMFHNFSTISKIKPVTFLVYVGEHDSPVFVEQSRTFANILKSQGLSCQLKICDELDHFDIVEKLDEDNYEIINDILKSLI